MEWEEALLTAWGGEIPPHAAAYYRRKAARARRVAEGATRHGCSTTLIIMMSLLPRPIARERKQNSQNFLNAAPAVS